MEAFHILKELLSKQYKDKKKVVFIDEIPWMDTPRSGFLVAFEAFWNGLSFELVCHLHLKQIKKALQIGGVLCNYQTLRTKSAQIDLLLSRADHVTNLCEAKFYSLPFTITSNYQKDLLNKLAEVKEVIQAKNSLHLTIISTYG